METNERKTWLIKWLITKCSKLGSKFDDGSVASERQSREMERNGEKWRGIKLEGKGDKLTPSTKGNGPSLGVVLDEQD